MRYNKLILQVLILGILVSSLMGCNSKSQEEIDKIVFTAKNLRNELDDKVSEIHTTYVSIANLAPKLTDSINKDEKIKEILEEVFLRAYMLDQIEPLSSYIVLGHDIENPPQRERQIISYEQEAERIIGQIKFLMNYSLEIKNSNSYSKLKISFDDLQKKLQQYKINYNKACLKYNEFIELNRYYLNEMYYPNQPQLFTVSKL